MLNNLLILKQKFRLKDIEIDGYYFIEHEGLYWHSGAFWIDEKKVKQVYNNGSLAIMYYNSKLSINQLRKKAKKCKIKLLKEVLPF